MNVKLVSVTQSFVAEEKLSPEELIIYIARVSNPGNQLNKQTAPKLIQWTIDNKHWSPYEMVDMTVEIKTSRAIAQQILRHRSFSFQEFSQRYAEVTEMEPVELRMQATKNRQSSTEEATLPEDLINALAEQQNVALHLYSTLLKKGVAKECARFILPLNTQTTMYMKGSVRSWIHYLGIRDNEHAQKEHQQVAKGIREIFCKQFPVISKVVYDNFEKYVTVGKEEYLKLVEIHEEYLYKNNISNI